MKLRKLALSKQTLKRLSPSETALVAGAGWPPKGPDTTSGDTGPCTGYCETVYCSDVSVCLCTGVAGC